jgi:predicted PhzF superfamily epimerase YddE/YHI9
MSVMLLQVDAFAERAFAGNPAAVCLLDGPAGEAWMQAVAAEMNLSETAFLYRNGDGYALRWFTPVAEVELCGHATLASAHALWETGREPGGAALSFATLSGTLSAARDGDWIVMDFPATPPEEAAAPPALAGALGLSPRWAGRSRFDWFVEAGSPAEVAAARPDMHGLAALEGRGVIVSAAGGRDGTDVTSRYFAPSFGIPEDPVTGSAHCALAPFWGGRLGRDRLVCHQASARGGIVRTELRGDRVLLGGRAVTVLEGRLTAVP